MEYIVQQQQPTHIMLLCMQTYICVPVLYLLGRMKIIQLCENDNYRLLGRRVKE